MASLTTGAVVAGSAFAPLALRTFDGSGQSFTRPSVAGPALLGAGLIGAGMAVDRNMLAAPIGNRRGFSMVASLAGTAMLGGAAANALTPSSGSEALALPA
jgi:hypothetical protein